MRDYEDDVAEAAAALNVPPILMGWSMGGLVAMMAAERVHARAVIGLAPSTPSLSTDTSRKLRRGEFGAEEYGITTTDPDSPQPAMPDLDREERAVALASLCRESRYARDERAAGVVVLSLPCPLLIVTGSADTQWPRSKYDALHLDAEHISIEGASHWGLVLSRRAVGVAASRVAEWLGTSPGGSPPTSHGQRLST